LTSACVAAASAELLGMKTSDFSPQPNSGRFTRSPGFVNSTCRIRSRTWSSSAVVAERPRASMSYG
jgi:hypothetical protein